MHIVGEKRPLLKNEVTILVACTERCPEGLSHKQPLVGASPAFVQRKINYRLPHDYTGSDFCFNTMDC